MDNEYLKELVITIGEQIALDIDMEIVNDILFKCAANSEKKFYSYLQYKGSPNMNGEFTLMIRETK